MTIELVVASANPDKVAEIAAILREVAGDRITAIDSTPVPSVSAYLTAIQALRAGTAVEVTLQRAGKEMKLKVVPE